jgi:hypothetical protein
MLALKFGVWERQEMLTEFFLEDLGVDENIILEQILRKYGRGV